MRSGLLACCLLASAYGSALPVTPRTPQGDVLHAKLDQLLSALLRSSDVLHAKVAAIREHRAAAAAWTWEGFKTYAYGKFTTHGRKMQDISAYLGDFQNAISSSSASLADFMGSIRGSITCQGTTPNAAFVQAFIGALGTDSATAETLTGIATSALECFCASEWNFADPALEAIFSRVSPLMSGGAFGAEQIDPLVFAVRDALPVILGTSGTCSGPCRAATVSMITAGLGLAESAAGITFPTALKNRAPNNFVGCECDSQDVAGKFNTLFGYFGTSPSATFSSSIINGDTAASDVLMQAVISAVDYMLGPVLCSSTCRSAFEDGVNLGFIGNVESTTVLNAGNDLFRLGFTEFGPSFRPTLPTVAEVETFSGSFVGCMCNMDLTSYGAKVMQYFRPSSYPAVFPSAPVMVAMIEDISTSLMNATAGSGGFCASGDCPAMLGNLMSMFSRIGNWVLHRDWAPNGSGGGETSGTSYRYIFTGEVMSTTRIAAMGTAFPSCMCSYFDPAVGGNVFPQVLRLITAAEGSTNPLTVILEIFFDSFRSGRFCRSASCRSLFATVHAIVDDMVNLDVAGAVPTLAATQCSAANVATCMTPATSGGCFPLDQVTATGACAVCYEPARSAITQGPPMSFTNDKQIDRTAFWTSCFVATDCPPEGVSGYVVTTTFTVDATVESFDATAQASFKANYADMLNGASADLAGTFTAADVTLAISSGSIAIQASVVALSPAVSTTVEATINSMDATTISSTLGVTVNAIAPASVATANYVPPAPPGMVAPGMVAVVSTEEVQNAVGMAMGVLIGITVGSTALVILLIVLIVVLCCCCKKKAKTADITPVAN